MDDLEQESVDRWLDRNESQRKALKSMLKSLKSRDMSEGETSGYPEKQTENKNRIMNKITQLFKKLGMLTLMVWLAGSLNLMAQDFVPGKVRVKIRPNSVELVANGLQQTAAKGQQFKTGLSSLDKINARFAATRMTRVFPHAGKNEAKHIKHGLHLWYEIDVYNEADLNQVVSQYGGNEHVEMAEAIHVKAIDYSGTEVVGSPSGAKPMMSTDDPYLADQWHLFNDGTLPNSLPGADINVMPAWDITGGTKNVIVAVVDGGIDTAHEDLKNNLWVNEAELNGEPGVDDDFNGFTDDIYGYNFADGQGEVTAHDHGTHVAGTVAATSNNGKGVAGVAGGTGNGDGIRMISAQVFSDSGAGNFAAAIVYGADNGAVISQNSWGYQSAGAYEQSVIDAIDYFVEEAGKYAGSPMKGGVVIFAAGNNGRDELHYPGYYDQTIAIAATGTDFTKAYYSNYGAWVDLSTTGGDYRQGSKNAVLSTLPGNRYGYMQGTSMATPHASGVAALIVSAYGTDNFTPDQLKQRLFTGVREIESYNPDYEGKLGVGFMDAHLAVAPNDMMAPEAITDLALLGASQDFASLNFSIPADAGDITPYQYRVYYAKDKEFSGKQEVVIANDFRAAGTLVEVTVEGLDFETTYYFAVVAEDRWGNASAMSNTVEATTNRGPDIATDKANLSFSIDTQVASEAMDQLNVLNQDVGILNWTAETREVSNQQAWNKVELPAAGTRKSVAQMDVAREMIETLEQFELNSAAPNAWEASDKSYYSPYGLYVIGELDTTMTNSSATRFVVDEEEGFNMTYVSAYLRLDQEDGNAVMEIYKGDKVHPDNLIYADDRFVPRSEDDARYYAINLSEQLFFEKGETFWIVFHTPAGNLYPLGIGPKTTANAQDNSFMSFDLGETWVPLAGAIGNENYVWAVKASSKIAPLHKYVTLTPDEGQVVGIGEESVAIDVDGSQLINGTYRSNIVISSNDADTPNHRVPVQVTVSGHKPALSTNNILDFGSVFHGLTETREMTIINSGLGRFKTQSVTSSDPQFVVNTSTWGLNVAAKSEATMSITFTPSGVGNQNAVITMTSANGDVHTFNVFGVGTEPAQLTVAPTVITMDSVMVGESPMANVTITNNGQYPLQYGFPAFTDDLSHIENLPANVQRFAYVMESKPYDSAYVFNDITASGTDITEFFKGSVFNEFYNVDLGFNFPYYGEAIDHINITKRGILTLGEDASFNATSAFHGQHMPDGYISAYLREWALAKGGSVHFKRELGKLIVQYTNVRHQNDRDTVAITFQIELHSNGDILFIYDKFDGLSSWSLRSVYSAIENRAKNDGVLINSSSDKVVLPVAPQQIVHIHSPGIGLVKSVEAAAGMLQPGESRDVVVTIDGEKLIEGMHKEYISVLSNDPFNASEAIELNIDVIGGGVSQLVVDQTAVDFGNVFQQASVNGVVAAKNEGSKQIEITNISFMNGQLTFEGDTALTIEPNQTLYINYTLNTQTLGAIDDTLVITDAQGGTYEVAFTGTIVDAPAIEVAETSYTEALEPDQQVTKPFVVSNTGKATLEYAIAATEHVSVAQPAAPSAVPEFTYVYRSTYDDVMKPVHQWIKLNEEDEVTFYVADDDIWEVIDLPFEFEFYQEKYSKVWMSSQGVLSFDEITDESLSYFTPPMVPTNDELNNIIAPYFAAGGPNITLPEDQWGRYMKAFDDKVVFEWRGYNNLFGIGGNFSIQAILYKNGKIKFQYKSDPQAPIRAFYGLVGIENKTGDDGLQIAYYQDYVDNGVAIDIYPARKETLEAGQSRTYDLTINTTGVNAGVYEESLKVFNNTPLTPEVVVPVNLTVSGEAALSFIPETVDLGEQMLLPNAAFVREFSFTNTGKKTMTVSNLRVEDPTTAKIEHLIWHFRWGWRWVTVPATETFTVEPGFESKKIRLTVTPTVATDAYMNKVLADTDFGTTEELPITGVIKLPPSFTVNAEEIYHMAYNNDVYTHTLNLGNVEGESPLHYAVSMNYDRNDVTPASNAIYTTANATLLRSAMEVMPKLQAGTTNAFSNVLAYTEETQAYTLVGFNGTAELTTATEFIAPSNGFNLSHVQTWYAPGSWLSSDIMVEIRIGDNVETADVLHSEVINYTVDAADNAGQLITLALSETLELNPYEKFHVVFTYPLGALFPQGLVYTESHVPNRYKFFSQGFWFDIDAAGMADSGWMVRAAEVNPATKNWILLNGNSEGEVAVGSVYDLEVQLLPERAVAAHNTASVSVATNDPLNDLVEIPVTLDINQAPKLIAEEVYYVHEMDTLELTLQLTDLEQDLITSATLVTQDPMAKMTFDKDMIFFTYTPGYEDSGMHTFEIATEDENGIQGSSEIKVEVYDVNRKPEAVEIPTQYINLYTGSFKLDFAAVFADPDGEPLAIYAENTNADVIDMFENESSMMLSPIKLGSSTVTLTGIDPRGSEVSTTFDVVVIGNVQDDAYLDKSWKVHPNPVDEIMNIKMYRPVVEDLTINFYNAMGVLIKTVDTEGSDTAIQVPVEDLRPGIYFVEMTTENAESVKKIVKQ